uniref:UbiA prenyltransferase domain-containing protein 1 n=1 Tax=Bactrocera latifrons TaxID=174628 RepID=A0A0K8VYU1_BACLA
MALAADLKEKENGTENKYIKHVNISDELEYQHKLINDASNVTNQHSGNGFSLTENKCKTKTQQLNGTTSYTHTTSSKGTSTGTFMKLKTYLHALRPWSLSGSLVPTLMGSALAYRSQWAADFSLITFFLTAFTVVTVHCAGNVVNTYFDFVKGIDKQKADDRTLVDHILTKDEVRNSFALL